MTEIIGILVYLLIGVIVARVLYLLDGSSNIDDHGVKEGLTIITSFWPIILMVMLGIKIADILFKKDTK